MSEIRLIYSGINVQEMEAIFILLAPIESENKETTC
jgi:hypothetical protein